MDSSVEVKKKIKISRPKILIGLSTTLLLVFIAFLGVRASHAMENQTYSREEMKDMIAATALSFYYNNGYSDYGQYTMDNLGVTGNYYNSGTTFWRDLSVTPESVNRSNYYHVDCSSFAYLTYKNTIGYDMSEYKDLSNSIIFNSENEYKMSRINESSNVLETYRDATTRFGMGFDTGLLAKVANSISENNNSTGIIYDNLNNNQPNELAYYYISDGTETKEEMKQIYQPVKEKLETGDIIVIRKYNPTTQESNGHAMMYFDGYGLYYDKALLHSTGDDYTSSETSEKNKLYKEASILCSNSENYIENRIEKYYNDNYILQEIIVYRPLNTICDENGLCRAKNNPNNIKLTERELENNEARNELKYLRFEQWQEFNKTYYMKETGLYGWINNVLSEKSSVNINDPITYKLRVATRGKDENITYSNIEVKAPIPENTEFLMCNECEKTEDTIYWSIPTLEKQFSSTGKSYDSYIELTYTVRPTKEGTITNEGFDIITEQENILNLSELKTTVKPTINSYDKENLITSSINFENAVIDSLIQYGEGDNNSHLVNYYDLMDNQDSETVYLDDLGYIKSMYYNTYAYNLGYLNNQSIKNSIFKQLSYPQKNNLLSKIDGEYQDYTGSTSENIYTTLTKEEVTQLSEEQKQIYEMLVPGMYGGKRLKGNDQGDRIKFLRAFIASGKYKNTVPYAPVEIPEDENLDTRLELLKEYEELELQYQSDLEPGDIIVTYSNNATEATYWLYLEGDSNVGPVLTRFTQNENGDSEYIINDDQDLENYYQDPDSYYKPANQILNEIFSKDLFVVLRPSRIAKTLEYENLSMEENDSTIVFDEYTNLLSYPDEKAELEVRYLYDKYENEDNELPVEDFATVDFLGWFDKDGNEVTEGDAVVSENSHKIYAKYSEAKVTLPQPMMDGFEFKGWYDEENNKVGDANNEYIVTKSTTLTAKWLGNEYTIKYDANGGEGTMENSKHRYYEESSLNENEFTKFGYEFVGWSTTPTGPPEYSNLESVYDLSSTGEEITLYAQWEIATYYLTLELNGGTYPDCLESTYEKEFQAETETFTVEEPTKDGFIFAGWIDYFDEDENIIENLVVEKGTNRNLYYIAVWKDEKYLVKYEADEHLEITGETSEEVNYKESPLGTTVDVEEGYKFLKWTVDKDVLLTTGETILKNSPITLEQIKQIIVMDELVITAHSYTDKYMVRYNPGFNGIITGIEQEEVDKNDSPLGTTIQPNIYYVLTSWTADKNVTLNDENNTVIEAGKPIQKELLTKVIITEDITFTANYELAEYKINYTTNEHGMITGIKEETVVGGTAIKGTTVTANKDYMFLYWTANQDVKLTDGKYISKNTPIAHTELVKVLVSDDTTFTAVIVKEKIKITYVGKDGIVITGNIEETVDYGKNPLGTTIKTQTPVPVVFTVNKTVMLSDGTKIPAGKEISLEQLRQIVANDDIIITAQYAADQVVKVEDTAKMQSIIKLLGGILFVIIGFCIVFGIITKKQKITT